MPFFSIIIPVYNKEAYIEDCLKSVFDQTFSDFEVIAVNDGSTDGSLEKLQTFLPKKIQILNQENLGVSIARNKAANLATGTFLAFLDADDVWTKTHLATLLESIQSFPKVNFVANNYWIRFSPKVVYPAKVQLNTEKNQPMIVDDFFGASHPNTLVWTSSACIKREVFFKYGQFNPKYKTGQDLDLWIRLALSEPLVFNPKKTMIYNYGIEDSLSKSEFNVIRLNLFNSYKLEEKKHLSLKRYLDIKRYGLALRCKINGETNIFRQAAMNIDKGNLSLRQRVLLQTPSSILKMLYKLRPLLIKNKNYLRIFKS